MDHPIPIYLGLMLVAMAHMTTTICNIHAWGHGIVRVEPWRQKASSLAPAVITGLRAAWRSLWRDHHQALTAAAVLLYLLLAHPSAAHAVGAMAIAGTLNIDQLERDLAAKKAAAEALYARTATACQAHEEKDREGKVIATGRLMTDDEKAAVQALINEGTAIKARIEQAKGQQALSAEIDKLTAGMTRQTPTGTATPIERRSLGQQFIDSEVMAYLNKQKGRRGTGWSSPVAELQELRDLRATTLDESSGSGGPLIVTQYQPGILPLLFKRLVVADLLASGTTDTTSITYMRETTFTNNAQPVAEGAPRPESALAFDQVTDNVREIAHWLPVTNEMLDDVSQIRSYIDARLALGLDLAEEDQLLNGSGTAPALTGLLNRSNLTASTVRSGSTTNADAIFTAMMAVFNASFVMPTGHIVNPANWQTTQLSKDGEGRYYGSGPFQGPQVPTLWGLPVAVTPSIVANTAFTGAFASQGQVFRRGGTLVEVSNSHQDFFVRNLTAVRAQRRLALCVYRPAAFSKITSLT